MAIFYGTVIAGAVDITVSLYVATWMAPLITKLAKAANYNIGSNSSISALSDGGLWTNFIFLNVGKKLCLDWISNPICNRFRFVVLAK